MECHSHSKSSIDYHLIADTAMLAGEIMLKSRR